MTEAESGERLGDSPGDRAWELHALRKMVDADPSALSFVDRELRLIAANSSCIKSLGLREREAIGKRLQDLLPCGLYEQSEPFLLRCLQGEEQVFKLYSPDGSTVQGIRCLPSRGEGGEVEGLIESEVDLSLGEDRARHLEEREFELAVKETELRRLSTTDALSGAQNRGAILCAFEVELQRAERYGRPLALILFDLDRFKLVNDLHGRAAGDEAIVRLAAICRASFRTTDFFGRYGGEEFLAVLPEVDREGAAIAAERVRSGMQAERFRALSLGPAPWGADASAARAEDEFTVTVSAGVADFEKGLDADRLLARADAALHRAKEKGRNRVELHVRH